MLNNNYLAKKNYRNTDLVNIAETSRKGFNENETSGFLQHGRNKERSGTAESATQLAP